MEVSGELQAPVTFFLQEKRHIHWIGDCVGARAGLDETEKRNMF
jgi:hypothetical protein